MSNSTSSTASSDSQDVSNVSESAKRSVSGKSRSAPRMSCVRCFSGKRSCDRALPKCSRCTKSDIECVYRDTLSQEEELKVKLKRKEDRKAQEMRRAIEDSQLIPRAAKKAMQMPNISTKALTKVEMVMDELFLLGCLQNFDRTMGMLFDFRADDIIEEISDLHSTVARSVRTDAAMALICRGMGWADYEKLYRKRILSKCDRVISDRSPESFPALTLVALSYYGSDSFEARMLIGHSIRKKIPTFDIDLRKPLGFFTQYFVYSACQESFKSKKATDDIVQRAMVQAKNVRAFLDAKLSPEDIERFGPFDLAHLWRSYSFDPEIDDATARQVLIDLDAVDRNLDEYWGTLSLNMATSLRERHTTLSSSLRCILYFRLGNHDEARRWCDATYTCFNTVSSALWFFCTYTCLTHCLDVSISLSDQAMFERGMAILRRMAPVYPVAEKLCFALSDVRLASPPSPRGIDFPSTEALDLQHTFAF